MKLLACINGNVPEWRLVRSTGRAAASAAAVCVWRRLLAWVRILLSLLPTVLNAARALKYQPAAV